MKALCVCHGYYSREYHYKNVLRAHKRDQSVRKRTEHMMIQDLIYHDTV